MVQNTEPANPLGKEFYYPSLDGLRFFAFLFVFLGHAIHLKPSTDLVHEFFRSFIVKGGWIGVDLFFVLSGFLITSLLLRERETYGNFSIKKFWFRRILRIWPLYYLALIMAYFLVPFISSQLVFTIYHTEEAQKQLLETLPFFSIFMGNWSMILYGNPFIYRSISLLWSVSIEEQFYLLWPLILFRIYGFRNLVLLTSTFIIGALLFRFILSFKYLQILDIGVYMNTFARIDTLMLGSLLAVMHFYKPTSLHILNRISKTRYVIISFILLTLVIYSVQFIEIYTKHSSTFMYLIMGLFMVHFVYSAIQPQTAFTKFLRLKPFVFLGKISYGLYVWHILSLNISLYLVKTLGVNSPIVYSLTALLITIIISVISYYFYEAQFLKLKHRFTNIKSRPL